MGEESKTVLTAKRLWLNTSCRAKKPTLERHAGGNILQEIASSLVKVSRGEKLGGFISPGVLNEYLCGKDCLQWCLFLSAG